MCVHVRVCARERVPVKVQDKINLLEKLENFMKSDFFCLQVWVRTISMIEGDA